VLTLGRTGNVCKGCCLAKVGCEGTETLKLGETPYKMYYMYTLHGKRADRSGSGAGKLNEVMACVAQVGSSLGFPRVVVEGGKT